MRYYFITKKENVELARDESLALIRAYDKDAKIIVKNRLIIVESDADLEVVWRRASMLRYAGKSLNNLSIKSFRCKVINLRDEKVDHNQYIDRFVCKIKELTDAKVSLTDPDLTFGIIIDDDIHYCILLDKYKKRLRKIYRHPAELNDRLAILMINLAGIKEGILLDTCCGTGTIVIYASYMGLEAIGTDISMKMCRYAKANLDINKLQASIINCDATMLPIKRVDVIVSNMPYGRASSTYNRECKRLIRDIIEESCARKVIMCKKGDEPEHIKSYDLYVHSNLSRRLVICR